MGRRARVADRRARATADTGRTTAAAERPLSRRKEAMRERRMERQLRQRREYWSAVRQEVERLELAPFLEQLAHLARTCFGESATVMRHLRGRGSRRHVAIVVDAARPDAMADFHAFRALEQQFWTAYALLAPATARFVVAVRPARGWLSGEDSPPLFTAFGGGWVS